MDTIALVWPESTFLIDPMYYPPLGLFYVWRALEEQYSDEVEVVFADLDEDKLPQADIYFFSGTTPQRGRLYYYADMLNKEGHTTVLGGPHAMAFPEEAASHFNLVITGEVDTDNIVDVLSNIYFKLNKHALLNLGHCNMDALYPPVRYACSRYHARLDDQPCTTMMTSFGCPYQCAFCASHDLYGGVRYFNLEHVMKDIHNIREAGFRAVQIYDDTFLIDKYRTAAMAYQLNHYRLIWRCFMRSDLAVRHGNQFLWELHKQGLREVLVGVESASNQIKRNIYKGTVITQDTMLLEWCKEMGIRFKASIILGLPGETSDTMNETKEWILKYRPDKVDVNTLIPMRGTPIGDDPGKFDCAWDAPMPDEMFYKGIEEEVPCVVHTDELSSKDIADFRLDLLGLLRAEGISY